MIEIKRRKINQYIKKKNYSLEKFSVLTGVAVDELNKILKGDMDFKFISLILLANYFDVSIDDLIDFKRKPVQTSFYI